MKVYEYLVYVMQYNISRAIKAGIKASVSMIALAVNEFLETK